MKLAPLIAAALILCLALPGATGAKGKKPKPKPKPKTCLGKDKQKYEIGKGYLDTKTCIKYTCQKKGKKGLKMAGKKMPRPCSGTTPSTPAIPQLTTTTPTPPPDEMKFQLVPIYRPGDLATVAQVRANQQKVANLLNRWTIALLDGGKMLGYGYGGNIIEGDFTDEKYGEKIIILREGGGPENLVSSTGVPLGTIVAWVNKPHPDGPPVPLPYGWQPCDGSEIYAPSIWAGFKTPDLNNEKRFLRGGPFEDMLNMEEETTRLPDHTHIDNGHTHTATSSADPHSHDYKDRNMNYADNGGGICGGSYWSFFLEYTSRTTKPTTVTVKTTIQKDTSNMGGVKYNGGFSLETRPINMNVVYIMKIY